MPVIVVVFRCSRMVFSKEDKAVIKTLFEEKGWRGRRIVKEFPNKKWNPRSIDRLICKLVQTGTIDRSKGSGRPRTARTEDNIAEVDEVIKSQEDQPGTHLSKRKISQNLGISLGSVHNIVKKKTDMVVAS